jgi:hypothetical protein
VQEFYVRKWLSEQNKRVLREARVRSSNIDVNLTLVEGVRRKTECKHPGQPYSSMNTGPDCDEVMELNRGGLGQWSPVVLGIGHSGHCPEAAMETVTSGQAD